MSVSLRFHPLQPKNNRVIKDSLEEILKRGGESGYIKDSKHRNQERQLTIHQIDALSKFLASRNASKPIHGSLMDELFENYDPSEFYSEDQLKLPELSSSNDSTSDSDTDVGSMSSSTSIGRDDFVSFARSLRYKQADPLSQVLD